VAGAKLLSAKNSMKLRIVVTAITGNFNSNNIQNEANNLRADFCAFNVAGL
jgi:hypothetical protein